MSIDLELKYLTEAKDLRTDYSKSESEDEKKKLFHQIYTAEKKAEEIRRLKKRGIKI